MASMFDLVIYDLSRPCMSASALTFDTPQLYLEIAELIASGLETVHDVLAFSLVCRLFNQTVNSNQFVFRHHFLRTYEPPRNPGGYDYKLSFRQRYGENIDEEVLRDMILDARPSRNCDPSSPSFTATSPNLEYISKIFRNRPPPPALRGLLYPLQFLSPTRPLFREGIDPKLDAYHPSIMQNFHSETDTIADSFAACLHPSNRKHSLFRNELALLHPSEFPSFWKGDLISQDRVVSSRWFGAYLSLLFPCDRAGGGPALTDIALNFSTSTTFSSVGHDVGPYVMRQGQIVQVGSQKHVSWIKDYGTHRWRYEGVLEGGGQRIVGVWGGENLWEGQGLFMFWAVPEDAVDLSSR